MMDSMKRQAARKIKAVDFPAVILDDKGHDFFTFILKRAQRHLLEKCLIRGYLFRQESYLSM